MIPRIRLVIHIVLAVPLLSAAAIPALAAGDEILTFDKAHTRIAWTLPAVLHTVHGTFKLKNGVIQFDPDTGKAGGLIVVDATSGQSGDEARDRKMHKDVLESSRYPEITFTPTAVHGAVARQATSQVQLDGIFSVHGAQHPLTLKAQVNASGGLLTIVTQFSVPYAEWGMKNPSTLFLRVPGSVQIEIQAQGRLEANSQSQ
jgi:polyisoprenoid-binding protein YceI